MESPFTTALKIAGQALLALSVYILLLVAYLYSLSIPETDMQLGTLTADTTFTVGRVGNNDNTGGHLSIRASGETDDSTAVIFVEYPHHSAVALSCYLPKGKVDEVWSGDFYERGARIWFFHKGVKRGKLRLQIVFSFPPPEWGFKWMNGRWTKENGKRK